MSDDFDPFADQRTPKESGSSATQSSADDAATFDPWGDAATTESAAEAPTSEERAAGSGALGKIAARLEKRGLGAVWQTNTAAEPTGDATEPPRIVVVCTGNVCRSPYVDLRLADALADCRVQVESAGTRALVGRGIDPGSAALLTSRGISSDAFRARQLTEQIGQRATLIVVATREHRRQVVQLVPSALQRTFTIREFAALVAQAPSSLTSLAELLEYARSERVTNPAGGRDDADIVDPFRRDETVFQQMAQQADPAVDVIAGVLRRILR